MQHPWTHLFTHFLPSLPSLFLLLMQKRNQTHHSFWPQRLDVLDKKAEDTSKTNTAFWGSEEEQHQSSQKSSYSKNLKESDVWVFKEKLRLVTEVIPDKSMGIWELRMANIFRNYK